MDAAGVPRVLVVVVSSCTQSRSTLSFVPLHLLLCVPLLTWQIIRLALPTSVATRLAKLQRPILLQRPRRLVDTVPSTRTARQADVLDEHDTSRHGQSEEVPCRCILVQGGS